MRRRAQGHGLTLHAITGTYVVMLGIDIPDVKRRHGLLGFAIHRKDETEGEQYWLPGYKTFAEVTPHPTAGSLVSTQEAPVQNLLWSDYTAKPAHTYVYTIVPISGTPKNLQQGDGLSITISTEDVAAGTHSVFFNRGVIGSEAYARKFGNLPPAEVANGEAYRWLSRGLEEAMLAFIHRARGKHYGLRAAVYEFDWQPVLGAFAASADTGADVKIVYDHRKKEPAASTDKAAKKAGIRKLMHKRQANKSYLSHNKFIILLKRGKPVEVWTGSTNFTESGIFGQSNVGHLVRDPDIAAAYLAYWEQLYQDEPAANLRKTNALLTPDPDSPPVQGTSVYFSPRGNSDLLGWYADQLATASSSACLTAAFGVNDLFEKVLMSAKPYPRFVLMEKPDNHQKRLARDPNVKFAIGTTLTIDAAHELEHWLTEFKNPLGRFVLYVHTKYMLIDPLGDSPIVITGSANFSEASTTRNEENMLVIRGDTRVADIYLGEFLRLFDHFRFRDVVNRLAAIPGSQRHRSAFLTPNDHWLKPYYVKGNYKYLQRRLFA